MVARFLVGVGIAIAIGVDSDCDTDTDPDDLISSRSLLITPEFPPRTPCLRG